MKAFKGNSYVIENDEDVFESYSNTTKVEEEDAMQVAVNIHEHTVDLDDQTSWECIEQQAIDANRKCEQGKFTSLLQWIMSNFVFI
jgi:hypothetical protein